MGACTRLQPQKHDQNLELAACKALAKGRENRLCLCGACELLGTSYVGPAYICEPSSLSPPSVRPETALQARTAWESSQTEIDGRQARLHHGRPGSHRSRRDFERAQAAPRADGRVVIPAFLPHAPHVRRKGGRRCPARRTRARAHSLATRLDDAF